MIIEFFSYFKLFKHSLDSHKYFETRMSQVGKKTSTRCISINEPPPLLDYAFYQIE